MTIADKFVNNIRKLVDKTPIVDLTVTTKPPIPASRGIDDRNRQKSSRQDVEVTYTLKQLVDTNVPKLQEDQSLTDYFEHLGRVITMVDSVDDMLSIKLKPDGVFDV